MPKGLQGFQKGHKGFLTQQHYKIISIKLKGRKISKETRKKISLSLIDKKLSIEHRKNLSISHIGIQAGNNHPQWKGGKERYHCKIANSVYKEHHINIICEKCSLPSNIQIHHKDRNRKNNNIDNLQALCRKCHASLHHRNIVHRANGRNKRLNASVIE